MNNSSSTILHANLIPIFIIYTDYTLTSYYLIPESSLFALPVRGQSDIAARYHCTTSKVPVGYVHACTCNSCHGWLLVIVITGWLPVYGFVNECSFLKYPSSSNSSDKFNTSADTDNMAVKTNAANTPYDTSMRPVSLSKYF